MTLATTSVKVKTQYGQYLVQGPNDTYVTQDVEIINRHTLSVKAVLSSALVTGESSRSVAEKSNVGSVTGGSYPDTGATSQTLVLPAGSRVILTFTHTMSASASDSQGNVKSYAARTPVLSVTLTEENGVDVTDVPLPTIALATILHGPGALAAFKSGVKFSNRGSNVPVAMTQFFGGTGQKADRLAKMLDWLENDGDLADFIDFYETMKSADVTYTALAALDEAQGTFASLAAATTAVNTTNARINAIETALQALTLR